ncbi:Ion channel, partial [Nitrosospira multiformis]
IAGITTGDIFDYFYYSSISYTTVGFGDLVPVG